MITKISTLAERAGVICPKDEGTMSADISCKECKYWIRCMNVIMGAI